MNEILWLKRGERWQKCFKICGPHSFMSVVRVRIGRREELRQLSEFEFTRPESEFHVERRKRREARKAEREKFIQLIRDTLTREPQLLTWYAGAIGQRPQMVYGRCNWWPELNFVKLGVTEDVRRKRLTIFKGTP